MSTRRNILLAILLPMAFWLSGLASDYFDLGSPAHLSMQIQLRMLGEAMYEYHSATGQWPKSLDDLARTSLPRRSPYWRQSTEPVVVLWPKGISGDAKANTNVLLVYYKEGLFNKLGTVWVPGKDD